VARQDPGSHALAAEARLHAPMNRQLWLLGHEDRDP
jgi:hypothetical protein